MRCGYSCVCGYIYLCMYTHINIHMDTHTHSVETPKETVYFFLRGGSFNTTHNDA